MARAALYLRVSTQDQADRALPIDGQRDECASLAQFNTWEVIAEYVDAGVSGTVRQRPGLLAAIAAAHRGEFSTLLAWDSSRLARDAALYGWILTELQAAGVTVAYVQAPEASPLEREIRAVLSAEQVRQIRAATVRGVWANAARQGRHGGDLFGYRWQDKHTRTIVDDEARVVREMYDQAATGLPLGEIARVHSLTRERTLAILRHPAYMGAHVFGMRRGGRRVPRDRWKVTPGAWPAIVPESQWRAVQGRLDRHRTWPDGSHAGRLALSGLLRCAECNMRLRLSSWHDTQRGRVLRYQCPDCRGRVAACGWTASIVQTLALHVAELAPEIARALRQAHEAGQERGHLEAEVARLVRARDTLLAVIESGEVGDPRQIAQRLDRVQVELQAAEDRLRVSRDTAAVPTEAEIRERLEQIAQTAAEYRADPQVDYSARPFLQTALSSVLLDIETQTGELELAETGLAQGSSDHPRFRIQWAA